MAASEDDGAVIAPDTSKSATPHAAISAAKLLVFALVIHLFVIPQLGGARKALSVLGSVNPYFLVAAFVFEAIALAVYAQLTQLLLPREVRPSWPIVFGTVLASTGVNHVVPGGAATTAAVDFRLLGAAGVPRDTLGIALGLQAVGSAVVLNAILWIALVVSIPTSGIHLIYATAAAVGAVIILAFTAAVLSLRRGRDAFADRMVRLGGRIPRINAHRVRSAVENAARQIDTLADDRGKLATVLALAAANWLFDAAALWITLRAFGTSPGINGLLVAYGLANVMAAIPISPGGLGVVEAILIPTLVGFGTPATEASVGVIGYRLIGFWLPIPIGAMAYAAVSRATGKRRRFRTEIDQQFETRAETG